MKERIYEILCDANVPRSIQEICALVSAEEIDVMAADKEKEILEI